MKKQLYLGLILLFSTTIFAQDSSESDKDTIKGGQIIKNAQKVIGTEKVTLNSFSLKMKTIYGEKTGMKESLTEVKVLLPDKFYKVTNLPQDFSMTSTSIWNGTKYKAMAEGEFQGQKYVTDITNSHPNTEILAKIEDKIGKEKVEKLKDYKRQDPKERFYQDVWKNFFPLTLIQPFEQHLEFKYVGKAKSGNQVANVVDVNALNGKNYRLFFDSETNYLLMMIESYKGENHFSGERGIYETKYYYSNREMVNNVLIPRKIKVEYKFTPDGKEPRISYENIEISEFSLNPEFKENMFDIK